MKISLSCEKVSEIDDSDWELVKPYRWTAINCRGHWYAISYWVEGGKKRHVLMHRLLLAVMDRQTLVDHRDGDGLNNKRENLRLCSHAENMRNAKVRSHSRSGIKNVALEKIKGEEYWRACVQKDGTRHRKYFRDKEAAAQWATEKRKELHGEFDVAARAA